MPKTCVALADVLVLALLCIPFVFLFTKPSSALTIQGVDPRLMGDGYSVTLALSNHTAHVYSSFPVRLELASPAGWKECPGGIYGFSVGDDLRSHAQASVSCFIKKMPPGSRLRLVVLCQRARKGLDSFIVRLRLRLSGKSSFSLNPFNKKVLFYTDPIEVVSDDFTEP